MRAGGRHPESSVGAPAFFRALPTACSKSLSNGDQLARLGRDEFAILASCQTLYQASELSGRLEWILSSQGTKATFGWAVHPQEGENALAVCLAASERLCTRKVMRGYARGREPSAPPQRNLNLASYVGGMRHSRID